jgi:hypothetical protein
MHLAARGTPVTVKPSAEEPVNKVKNLHVFIHNIYNIKYRLSLEIRQEQHMVIG